MRRDSGEGRVGLFAQARLSLPLLLLASCLCLLLHLGMGEDVSTSVDCCAGTYAFIDCASGVEHLGQHYYCVGTESPEMRACVSCIPPTDDGVQCSSCCGTTDTDCDLEWSWGAVFATLSVSAVFATCSGVLALAENRRKRKGISLARAWSIPQGMPVLRATVVDLSDAVRGRSSMWNATQVRGEGFSDDEDLEHVALLEEMPNDPVYGALVGQEDTNIPVAKLAEDNWVTAMAWQQAHHNRLPSGDGEEESQREGQAPVPAEAERPASPHISTSRWRSARLMARRARRSALAATGSNGRSRAVAGGRTWYLASPEADAAPPIGDQDAAVVVRTASFVSSDVAS